MRQAPVIGTLSHGQVLEGVGRAIEHCYILRSMPVTTDTMCKAKEEITDYILKRYDTMTLGELSMCLDMGARGELGNKDQWANIANMESWIRIYYECEQRNELLNEAMLAHRSKALLAEPTDEEKNEAMYTKRLPEILEYFRETGDVMVPPTSGDLRGVHEPMFGAVLYDMMAKRGEAVALAPDTMTWLQAEAREMMDEYRSRVRFRVSYDDVDIFLKCLMLRETMRQIHNDQMRQS